MNDIVFRRLSDPAVIDAFLSLWPPNNEVARREVDKVIELFIMPNSDETQSFVARLVLGLVGQSPDPLAWLRAIDNRGEEFRARRSSGRAANEPSPSRALERGSNSLQKLEQKGAESLLIDRERARLAVIVYGTIMHQLRRNVAVRAALGPAWTAMAAIASIDEDRHDVERQLYQRGADEDFLRALGHAIREVTQTWKAEGLEETSAKPTMKMVEAQLPPGVDAEAWFSAKAKDSLTPLDSGSPASADNEETPPAFSYFKDGHGNPLSHLHYSEEGAIRLRSLMPLIATAGTHELMAAAAVRAYQRSVYRSWRRDAPLPSDAIEDEICKWVHEGYPPPLHMRSADVAFFEEEACYNFLDCGATWSGLAWWRYWGFFPEDHKEVISHDELYHLYHKAPDPTAGEAIGRLRSAQG